MKSYTDLEQSKKLAEILPIESADMHYATWTILDGEFVVSSNQGDTIESLQEDFGNQIIPCWSLVALFEVLPSATLDSSDNHCFRLHCMERFTEWHDNAIDACYEMIIRLHELNKQK